MAYRTWNVRNAPYGAGMASDDHPWEPPVAGTEAEALAGALDRLRTTFRWKADDLDAAGLQTRVGASSLTIPSRVENENGKSKPFFVAPPTIDADALPTTTMAIPLQ